MSYLKLTYTIAGKSLQVITLDLLGQRWSARTMMQAIIKHEFPALRSEKMVGKEWAAERVVERFAITDIQYAFVSEGSDEVSLAAFKIPKVRPRQGDSNC